MLYLVGFLFNHLHSKESRLLLLQTNLYYNDAVAIEKAQHCIYLMNDI